MALRPAMAALDARASDDIIRARRTRRGGISLPTDIASRSRPLGEDELSPMRTVAIVQARMSSQRLPGKVLREVRGKPLLSYLTETLAHSRRLDAVVVATSDGPSDDVLESFCRERGLPCFRGPLEDVAQRFVLAGEAFGCDAFVRICGDSPLMDYRVVDQGIDVFQGGDFDLATNVLQRSFPAGISIEVADYARFREAYANMRRPDEREHVTLHYYENPENFRIATFAAPQDLSQERLTVDCEEGFARFARIVERMDRPHYEYSYDRILALDAG